jgi:hypothetical protein
MTDDVLLARLARANPAPFDPPARPAPARRAARRPLLVLAAVAAIAVPAAAFGSQIGGLLGLGDRGTSLPTSSVPEAQSMDGLDWPATSQLLGTRDGVSFYASKRADGGFCLAVDVNDAGPGSMLTCLPPDLAATRPILGVPVFDYAGQMHRLAGVAADGVARVALVAADGSEIASAPVVDNLYVDNDVPDIPAVAIVAYDAGGNAVYRQTLGTPPQTP